MSDYSTQPFLAEQARRSDCLLDAVVEEVVAVERHEFASRQCGFFGGFSKGFGLRGKACGFDEFSMLPLAAERLAAIMVASVCPLAATRRIGSGFPLSADVPVCKLPCPRKRARLSLCPPQPVAARSHHVIFVHTL